MTHRLAWSFLDPSKPDLLTKSTSIKAQLGHSLNANCLKSRPLMPIASMWFMAQLHKVILDTTLSLFWGFPRDKPNQCLKHDQVVSKGNVGRHQMSPHENVNLSQRLLQGDTKCHLGTTLSCPKKKPMFVLGQASLVLSLHI